MWNQKRHSESVDCLWEDKYPGCGEYTLLANEIKLYCFFSWLIWTVQNRSLQVQLDSFTLLPISEHWILGTEKLVLGNQNRLNLFLGRLEQGQFCNFMKSGKKSLCIFKILQNHETLKGTKIELHVSVKIELSMEFWLFGHFEVCETTELLYVYHTHSRCQRQSL